MDAAKNIRRIELLAPAKDLKSGIAAISHGADAVYIGAHKYGARAAAGNSLEDIAKLIDYAHRFWAKVYVPLNTILYDDELDEALAIARSVYDAGADALIVQDMGLLELDLPPIPLIASTQTHNYTTEKIKFLEKVGFQRIILARELSLEQIREIRKNTAIELEFFIHGALCASFSGQCYLSQATQGRSANRGECAQPCRLPYTLTDGEGHILAKDKHLLSLKDLNLSAYLYDLINVGIYSFKIEGRLKDVNYVKNVTAFYRHKIDEILEKDASLARASSGCTMIAFEPDTTRTFNRGFTDHFFSKRTKDILSLNTPKSVGALLGKVKKVQQDYFILENADIVHNGDGICFFNTQNVLCGTNINKVEGKSIYPSDIEGIEVGTIIYRNYDHKFAKVLQADKTKRLIRVKMQLEEIHDGFMLSIVDEDDVKTSVSRKVEKVPAKKSMEVKETIWKQLGKLGGTLFYCNEINIVWSQAYFLPVSFYNDLRRDAIAQLEQERKRQYSRLTSKITPNNEQYTLRQLDYSANIANKKAEVFYRRHGVEKMEPAFELQEGKTGVTVMTMKHCLRFQYSLCTGQGKVNAEPLYMQGAKNRYRLEFDCEECQMEVVLE